MNDQTDVTIDSADKAQYDFALAAAQDLLSTEQRQLLQLRLASRSFSPIVELHRSLALAYKATHGDASGLHERADGAFVVIGHSLVTDPSLLGSLLKARVQSADDYSDLQQVLDTDHVYGNKNDASAAFLYANLGSPSFRKFYAALSAIDGASFVLRHRPPTVEDRSVRLSGFGVEMHLKSTEYKVVDDSAASSASSEASSDGNQLEPVPKAEVKGLGLRIAQAIASSDAPLEALQRLSQNFPQECHAYRKVKLNSTFGRLIAENQRRMQAGHTAVLINGRHVNVENVNFFELLDILGEEVRSSVMLRAIKNLSPATSRKLTIRHTFQLARSKPYFDVRSPHVQWLNNVEEDPVTGQWPITLRGFLRQQWPGRPFAVRRNAVNVISLVDLSVPNVVCSLGTIGQRMGLVPSQDDSQVRTLGAVRVGLVPVGKSRRAQIMSKAFSSLMSQKNSGTAMGFLKVVCNAGFVDTSTEAVFVSGVESALAKFGSTLTVLKMDKDENMGGVAASNKWCENSFGQNTEELRSSGGFRVFVNGQVYNGEPDGPDLSALINSGIAEQTQQIQMMFYRQQLPDSTRDIHGFLLNLNNAETAFSRFSLSVGGPETPFVSFVGSRKDRNERMDAAVSSLSFVQTGAKACPLSHIAVVDLATEHGLELLESVVDRALEEDKQIRVALVLVNRPKLAKQIAKMWSSSTLSGILDLVKSAAPASPAESSTPPAFAKLMGITNGIVTNGRVMRIGAGERFTRNDFAAVESDELKKRAKHAKDVISKLNPSLKGEALSNAIMYACSVLGLEANNNVVRHDMSQYAQPTVTIPAKKEEHPALIIDALLDPLSEAGKKFGSILLHIISVFECEVNLVLNPLAELQDLPLKQFYRYVAANSLSFDASGTIDTSVEATAIFPNLPTKTLFSMSLDVPDSWVVDAVAAPYDLDNLRLSEIDQGNLVGALYELTHLAVTGECKDNSLPSSPVRGLQVHLTSVAAPEVSYETLVMETGGYYQLKAGPGLWKASLSGRSAELFQVEESSSLVLVSELSSVARTLKIRRRNSSTEPLLPVDKEADLKLAKYSEKRQAGQSPEPPSYLSSWWGGSQKDAAATAAAKAGANQKTIHVFSIASGHLYERFLSIMMYTTVRSTKSPVKFWFLKQFLSPQFKRFLPKMAAAYGFEFELVSYNFPRWLRRQTEKQRHIWAYKILFLDVLFPLSIDRIIFVDADQIVREDLSKLTNMDLQGAAYAFTPFCSQKDNRRYETKGFRFWESGYWKDTLGPLPYHISALFVIDLKRFRQMAAGDILRSSYQQLSADPGSLANLDQDLPNVLQSRLTIFSLPEEWLWCETWCTDDSFKRALSIDLCNNPQNKIPKLENAKRIFPDWTSWDSELNALRVQSEKQHHAQDIETLEKL